MRLFFGQLSASELLARASVCERARAAWLGLRDGDVDGACQSMRAIDARVELSVSESAEDGSRAASLAGLEPSAWPLVELMLAQAPSDIGYALSLGRSAVPLAEALAEALASHQLELERASLRAGFGRGHLLEVTLGVPGGTGSENEQIAAENLVRAMLGDRLFETWIGVVHVTPAPRFPSLRVLDVRAPRAVLGLRELFDTVAAATLGVLQGLPDAPRGWSPTSNSNATRSDRVSADAAGEDWTLLEVEPLADDRGRRKDDLVLASTCTPELLRCYLDGSPCSSRRFSRSGERFVFVSYTDGEQMMSARVARRTVIEAALSECVTGSGAVTGVGFGLKTTYVDLSLCDLGTGLTRLVSTLRQLDVPAQTFVQFFDSELDGEWLSIWPDSRLTEE